MNTAVNGDPTSGPDEDGGATGDLDVFSAEVIITGQGAAATTIIGQGDGTEVDRIFHVLAGGSLRLEDLTVMGGRATTAATNLGGAVYALGPLVATGCVFDDNIANAGGAVHSSDAVTIDETTFRSNQAQAWASPTTRGAPCW